MSRLLSGSWIDNYNNWIRTGNNSPDTYNLWAGISLVSAVLKRHCYINRGSYNLYPNMFTVLVGQPGIGKGLAINPAHKLLEKSGAANIISDRLSMSWVLRRLAQGFPAQLVTNNGHVQVGTDCSAVLFAAELSTFLRRDHDALSDLNELWDAKDVKTMYGTSGHGLVEIEKPGFSLLVGTAPTYLAKSIPNDAVGGGFTRRVNFVFANTQRPHLRNPTTDAATETSLIEDLKHIATTIQGAYQLTPEVKELFDEHAEACQAFKTNDQSVQNYVGTEPSHLLKVSMCLAAAEYDSGVISRQTWDRAFLMISEIRACIPRVFRIVGCNELIEAMDKIMMFLENRPYATRAEIMSDGGLWRDLTGEQLNSCLANLCEGDMVSLVPQAGATVYRLNRKGKP